MISKDKLKFVFFILAIIAIIVVSHIFDFTGRFSVEGIRDYLLGKGIWAPVIYYLIYFVTSLIVFPSVLLSTASGVVWGPWLGTFYTVTAATLASMLPFFLAKFFGRKLMNKVFKGTKLVVCDQVRNRNGFVALMLMRLIPIFPWEAVSYGAGLCGFHFRHYLPATILGMIPASFTYNLIGDSLGKPLDPGRILLIAAAAVFSLTVMFIYQRTKASEKKGK